MNNTEALERCLIAKTSSLRDALASLDSSGCKVVLIVDDGRVVGLLTDGDLRRAMLRGAALTDSVGPHMKRSFTSVVPRTSRADVLDVMQSRRIAEVPILDEQGRFHGLHRMHDVLARRQRTNWAVILAGGRGTRLAPLTETIPKPMIRVAGRPILERIVLHLSGIGITRIFLAINYLGHIVEEHFGDGSRFGAKIEYLRETKPLGTAGSLSLLPAAPSSPLVVMNGDLVTQADLGDLLDYHEREGHVATIGVRRYVHTVPFGCIETDGSRVVALEEKPTVSKVINAGIYVIAPDVLANIPRDAECTMPDVMARLIESSRTVGTYEIIDDWIDVGHKDQLKRAQGEEP
jgi:dTDP-glucose pyrophosphorylase